MLEDIKDLELLASIRTIDLSEPIDLYFKVADELQSTNRHNYISRANFIREQVNGKDGRDIFDKSREDWGIWNFDENILTVDDFRRGFCGASETIRLLGMTIKRPKLGFSLLQKASLLDAMNFGHVTKGLTNVSRYGKEVIKKSFCLF